MSHFIVMLSVILLSVVEPLKYHKHSSFQLFLFTVSHKCQRPFVPLCNKLDCLSFIDISALVYYLRGRSGRHHLELHFKWKLQVKMSNINIITLLIFRKCDVYILVAAIYKLNFVLNVDACSILLLFTT